MLTTLILGAFYQAPDGQIVYAYGIFDKVVMAYNEDQKPYQIPYDQFIQEYKLMNIRDFPNAKDPRLPHVFDMKWDLKWLSHFMQEAKDNPELMEEGQAIAKELGINLNDPQSLRDWNEA